jgi:hypothetical protein
MKDAIMMASGKCNADNHIDHRYVSIAGELEGDSPGRHHYHIDLG